MSVKFTLLGCGSSMGIPRIDGSFGNCDPKNKKNLRSRCSALISTKNNNIIIDTSPDVRSQLIKNKINNIECVFYTHHHADQTHGINELRYFYIKRNKQIPVYADKQTKKYLINSFKYCFKNEKDYPATLKLNNLKKKHLFNFKKEKIQIESFKVKHGLINSVGYIINKKCVYISDVSHVFKKDLIKLSNLNYFVIDCLRYKKHPSHFNLDDVLSLTKIINPKKTILTNLHSDLDYVQLKKKLPKNIIPGFDGLSFNI